MNGKNIQDAFISCSIIVPFLILLARGKVYERCELAKELKEKHEIPEDQLSIWTCIVHHESTYDTRAYNNQSHDYGLFQISELYWCNIKEDDFKSCDIPCDKLVDDDITDDVDCVKRIYNDFLEDKKDPFTAWVAYERICSKRDLDIYLVNCF